MHKLIWNFLTFHKYQKYLHLKFFPIVIFKVKNQQAGAELGQAQIQLELGLTLIKI